jgi:hypothetical protein
MSNKINYVYGQKKAKQSHYRPGLAQMLRLLDFKAIDI